MYTIDAKDKVLPLNNIPQSSAGAPCPIVLSNEHKTVVAYYIQEDNQDISQIEEAVSLVTFVRCMASMFGPPNDEAFNGHPLANRGLQPYSSNMIKDSSWLRILQNMNSVHPKHSPKLFEDYNHFILAFHDSTFECIAVDFEFEIVRTSKSNLIEKMNQKLT